MQEELAYLCKLILDEKQKITSYENELKKIKIK